MSLGGKAIKELVIPEGVNSIANNAFKNCKDLISLTVSPNVISISESAFSGCNNLNSIHFEDGIEVLTINTSSFSACPLTSIYLGRNLSYSNSPFSGRTKLTSVVIGDMVTSLGDYAFSGCSGLTSVTIPNSVTSIGESVFADCSDLTTIRFEDGENLLNIKKSSSSAQFSSCPLTTIYLGRNISYDVSPFKNLTQLTSLTIGNNVKSIGDYAFSGCIRLASVSIGNGVTSISDGAFRDCRGLTSVTIPNSVTSIGDGAFVGCSGLTSVSTGNSVTSIGDYAFSACRNLASVTIPNSVKTIIGDYAFTNCNNLTSVTIGNSVTSIGGGAFSGCTSLKDVYCYASIPPSLHNFVSVWDLIEQTYKPYYIYSPTLHVPNESIEQYRTQDHWELFRSIVPLTETETTIKTLSSDNDNSIAGIYAIDGKPVETLQKGVNIIRYSDGSIKKVYIK